MIDNMNLTKTSRKDDRLDPGWHSRGYLPHFDGAAIPQFVTSHLADSLPDKVLERWQAELRQLDDKDRKRVLSKRIEKYLDQGYGSCYLRNPVVAKLVQDSLLKFDGERYQLFSWVVMPNHTHSLLTRFDDCELEDILQAHKSYTAHEANKLLKRTGRFWMKEYFDRYIRNDKHFLNVVKYIENNPVKAGLCGKPSDWPFSSAWFREQGPKI